MLATLTDRDLFLGLWSITSVLCSVVAANFWYAFKRHLAQLDELQKQIQQMKVENLRESKDFVTHSDFKDLERTLRHIETTYVSKSDLQSNFSELKLALKDTETEVRKIMSRVHERIDDMYERRLKIIRSEHEKDI